MMAGPFDFLRFVSKLLNIIAGIALTFMMFLTVADVLLRAGRHPFVGTYEIVALLMALVIGFGIPQVSLDRGHVTWNSFGNSPRGVKCDEHLTRPVPDPVCIHWV
jgi:TRAP-type C4-dicarboxylate transport system permease small subunit